MKSLKHGRCRDVQAKPKKNLAEIVRMARYWPQSCCDKLSLKAIQAFQYKNNRKENTLNLDIAVKIKFVQITLFSDFLLNALFWRSATTSNNIPMLHNPHPIQSKRPIGRSFSLEFNINVGSNVTNTQIPLMKWYH